MTIEEKGSKSLFKKGEEFLNLYRKVENFTQEILRENERLRYQVAALEQESKNLKERLQAGPDEILADRITRLEKEKEDILQRYREVEQENIDFAKRYVEIEEENNNLANLYVASYQLHSTLEFKEVLGIVKEIVVNLIGADRFSVYLIDSKKGVLTPVIIEGMEAAPPPEVKLGEGIVGVNLQEEKGVYVAPELSLDGYLTHEPLVSIPLRIKSEPIGAIVIYGLLEQKKNFTSLDIELFNLLGGHAATAVFGSKLYSESKRKLTTIQGFLELLKPE